MQSEITLLWRFDFFFEKTKTVYTDTGYAIAFFLGKFKGLLLLL